MPLATLLCPVGPLSCVVKPTRDRVEFERISTQSRCCFLLLLFMAWGPTLRPAGDFLGQLLSAAGACFSLHDLLSLSCFYWLVCGIAWLLCPLLICVSLSLVVESECECPTPHVPLTTNLCSKRDCSYAHGTTLIMGAWVGLLAFFMLFVCHPRLSRASHPNITFLGSVPVSQWQIRFFLFLPEVQWTFEVRLRLRYMHAICVPMFIHPYIYIYIYICICIHV